MRSTISRHSYRHVRHAYQAVANREFARRRRELAMLIRQFVGRGALVFDIGANRGDYTDVLLTLGARVVAVEPNPALAERLRSCYPVAVEAAAVGSAPGTLPLHLGIDPGHSTLSERWLEQAPTGGRWGATVDVAVITVHELVRRHGAPTFMKIDVEGFEAEVLRGAETLPPSLSFEYQCSALDVTRTCLGFLDGYEFNTVTLGGTKFAGSWEPADVVLARIEQQEASVYGDVYARRQTRSGSV